MESECLQMAFCYLIKNYALDLFTNYASLELFFLVLHGSYSLCFMISRFLFPINKNFNKNNLFLICW